MKSITYLECNKTVTFSETQHPFWNCILHGNVEDKALLGTNTPEFFQSSSETQDQVTY